MKPLRQVNKQHVTYDPETGKDRIWKLDLDNLSRSSEGAINSDGVVRRYFKDCGCDSEIGGRCFICGGVSCKDCHGRCEKCKKPICLQHSHYLDSDDGEKVRFCSEHYDEESRKQKGKKFWHFLLSPFYDFGGK